MISRARFAKLTFTFATLGGAALLAQTTPEREVEASPTSFPFEARLVTALELRQQPSRDAAPVSEHHRSLAAATNVKVLAASGTIGTSGAFCKVEANGRTGWIRCDDTNLMLTKFCDSIDSCKSYCEKTCTKHSNDMKSTCTRVMTEGPGMLPPGSPALKTIPRSMKHVSVSGAQHATQLVLDGLAKLDDVIDKDPSWRGYKVLVKDCYRSIVEEVETECGLVLWGHHVRDKLKNNPPTTDAEKHQAHLAEIWVSPPKAGLAWPGADFHTSGNACDVVVIDHEQKWATSCAADNNGYGPPHTSKAIDVHAASKMLDDAMSKAGAKRLDYEMWHYEWGMPADIGCRCQGSECDKHWPPQCSSASCGAH